MKKTFLIAFILISVLEGFGQKIKYESSLKIAQQKSAGLGKPLFLHIHIAPVRIPTAAGLNVPEIAEYFNTHFINYLVLKPDSSVSRLMREHHVSSFPTYLFLTRMPTWYIGHQGVPVTLQDIG